MTFYFALPLIHSANHVLPIHHSILALQHNEVWDSNSQTNADSTLTTECDFSA